MADISREAFTDRPWDGRRGPEDDSTDSDLEEQDDGEHEGFEPDAEADAAPACTDPAGGGDDDVAAAEPSWHDRLPRVPEPGRGRALPMSPLPDPDPDASPGSPPDDSEGEPEPGLAEYEAAERAAADPAAAAADAEAAAAELDLDPDLDADGVAAPTDPAALGRVVLGLLFVAREPLTVLRLAQVCGTSQDLVRQALEHARATLAQAGLPAEVAFAGDQITLLTAPDVFPFVKRLRGIKKPEKLSAAALETLAVIAYRQPVMRAEIEAIRGVKAGPMLRSLLEHKLVKVVGRADVPGRPLQYGTTQRFLERFGLSSLKDLPSIKEFKSL